MLKNIMFWFLAGCATMRLGGLAYILWIGITNLPVTVIIISAITGVLMLAFIGKKFLFGCKRKEMEMIFIVNSIAVIFNTIYVSVMSLATVELPEIVVIGSFFEVIAGLTFVYLSKRRTKYITIPSNKIV